MLELTLSQVFLGLDESKKAEKPTLNLYRLFSRPGWEPDSAHRIPELFNTGNNPTDLAPMLDKTHEDIKK
jgi:hypothetical protein